MSGPTMNTCWFRPGCRGVPVFPGGICAKCAERAEKRAVRIPSGVRRKLDASVRRYAKMKAAQEAGEK